MTDIESTNGRRNFLKTMAIGSAALTGATSGLFGTLSSEFGVQRACAEAARIKIAFIQWQRHTVPAAWSKEIEEVLKPQQIVDYQLLDGQNKVEVQASLMDTLISQGASIIFLQPIDSVLSAAPS